MKTFLIFLFLSISIVSAESLFTNVIFLLDSIVRGGNINVGDIGIEAESVSNTLCGGNFSLLPRNRYFIDENFELQLVKVYFGRHASIEVFYKGGYVSTAYASPTFRKIFYAEDRNAILASTLVSVSPSIVDLNADLTYERGFESVTISERVDCTTGNLTVNVKQNNRPVRNAMVSLANADGQACGRKIDTKTTDGNGNVIFGRPFNGNYYVLVSGNGISGRKEIKIGPGGLSCDSKPPLTLTVDSSCNDGEVAISAGVDSNNKSVSDAKVEIFDESCTVLNKTATTTGNGRTIVMGLSEGTYCIKASKDGYTSAQTIVNQICPLPININTELICKNEKPALVVTTSSKTSPVKDATIALSKKINDRCGSSNSIEITNEQGNVTFSDLSEGSYCITAARDGYETSESSADILVSHVNQCKPPEDVKPEISTDILCPSRDLIINLKNAPGDGKITITPTFSSFSNLLSSFSCLSAEKIEEKVSDHLVISAQRLKENCRYIIDITANNKNLVSTTLLYAPSCPLPDMYVSTRADCGNGQLLVSAVDNAKVEVYDTKCENLIATGATDSGGITKLALANGNYCIKVSKEGYKTKQISADMFCAVPSLDISATADCKEGKITIASEVTSEGKPVDADVRITKFESGACTSETSEFTKGKYCVIANKNGYNAVQTFVDVSESLINQCKPPEPEPGDLSVDAELVCDGTNVLLKATVNSDGKKIENANIDLKANSCSDATIKSERTNAAGIVTFSNIEPNTYCVVASKDGYKTTNSLIPYIAYNAVANQCNVEPPQINIQTRGNCNNLAVAAFDNNGNRIDGATIEVYDETCTNLTGKNAITDNGIATITGLEGKNYCIKGSKSGYKEGKTVIELSCPLPMLDISAQPNCKDNKIVIEPNVTSDGKKVNDTNIKITEFKDGKCSADTVTEFSKGKYCVSASKNGYTQDDEIIEVSEQLVNQCKPQVVIKPDLNIKTDNYCKDSKPITNVAIADKANKSVNADITIRKRIGGICDGVVAIEHDKSEISKSLSVGSYCIGASASDYKDADSVLDINEAFVNQCKPSKINVETRGDCNSFTIAALDENGKGVNSASVNILDAKCDELITSDITDSDGIAIVSGLNASGYCVRVTKEGYETKDSTVSITCPLEELNVDVSPLCERDKVSVSTLVTSKGKKIKDAEIEIFDADCSRSKNKKSVTNDFGNVTIRELEQGAYCIKVTKPGYHTSQRLVNKSCESPTIKPPVIETPNIIIETKTSCDNRGFSVTAKRSDSEPLSNANIWLYDSACKNNIASSTTDGDGITTFYGLENNNYCIKASKSGFNNAQKDIALICAGASTVIKSDLVFSSEILCPDQDLKININANGAAVSIKGEGACRLESSKTSQNNFVIFSKEQLTKDCNYKIRATHSDYNNANLDVAYGKGALACANPSIKIESSILCPSELSVKVLVDNAPKQNANVKVMNKYTLLLGEFSPPSIVCNAKTDSTGQAKCTNLKQSEYMIEAEVALSSRTKYTTTETASLTNCAKLSDGSAASPIEPSDIYDILANESGNVGEQIIATTYKNGEPMPFANVSIVSPNGKELMTTTDGSGSVVVPLEFDGDYRLSLIKEPGLVVKSKTVKAVLNLGDIDVKETKAGFSLSPLHVLLIPLFLIVALLIYGYYRNRKEGEFYRV